MARSTDASMLIAAAADNTGHEPALRDGGRADQRRRGSRKRRRHAAAAASALRTLRTPVRKPASGPSAAST